MDKTYCHYHPAQPAAWHCAPCTRHFGDCCMPRNADAPDELPRCPLCGGALTYLGAANRAQPFWERIPRFFLYGLQAAPLQLAALVALVSLFMPSGFMAMVALLVVLVSLTSKYLEAVIEHASLALAEAPSLSAAFGSGRFSLFFQLLGLVLLSAGLMWLAADFHSEAIFMITALLIQLVLPAIIIRLALDKSLWSVLNPDAIGAVIKAMGWRYLILWVFCFMLWSLPDSVVYLLAHGLPRVVLMPVATFLFVYSLVVMSAMLGYAVFQYQGALGFAAAAEDEHAGFPEPEYRKRRALAEAEIRLKEGQAGQALEVLGKALDRNANDLRLNERYHQLLFAMQSRERCLRHLAHYLPLAARQSPAQAASALLNARQLQGDYLPEDALVCEKVAEALLARHKTREGLSLLRNFHQRFPDYPHVPRAYLLAARGFAEGLGQLEPAQKLLGFIRSRYPGSPLLDEVEALEAVISRLAAN